MGGPGAVCGDGSPVILQHLDAVSTQINHRLNGQNHAALESGQGITRAVVGNLRLLMQVAADSVSHIVPDDSESEGFDKVFNGTTDLHEGVALLGLSNAAEERLLCHGQQAAGFHAHVAHGDSHGIVSVPAVHNGTAVQTHDVAVLNHTRTADAVDNLLVYGDTELSGVAAVTQKGVTAFFFAEEFSGVIIYLFRGDAGANDGHKFHQDAGRNLAGFAKFADFVRITYGDAFCHGVNSDCPVLIIARIRGNSTLHPVGAAFFWTEGSPVVYDDGMLLSILLPLILPQAGIADVIESRLPVTWHHERYGTENGVLCPGYLPGCRWDLARLKNGVPSGISEAAGDVLLAFLSRWEEKLFLRFYKDPYVQYLPYLSRGGNVSGISVCLYRGVVQAPQSGTFHFVGCGGDVMAVRFDEREVLQSFGSETAGQAVIVEQGKLYLLEWLVAERTPKNAGGALYTEWCDAGENPVRCLFRTSDAPVPEAEDAPVWKLFHTTRESL